jgi:hypothetical protein
MNKEQDLIYGDDEAVKFIRNYLPQELKDKFSDDDLNYIIDLIYEFYDSKGIFFDDDDDDEVVEFDEDELIQFVIKNAKKDTTFYNNLIYKTFPFPINNKHYKDIPIKCKNIYLSCRFIIFF